MTKQSGYATKQTGYFWTKQLGLNSRVLVLSTIVGSIFLIWCDVAARMVLGNEELPIGIVTAMIGGPFFVWLMLTKSYGFGDE